ncbi:ATP-binding protein [Thalassovita sp.]|uniref:ATP-binding protein n=1 Tax=Thalassovita sp. TaxID=1979401 RepID=UPI002AB08C99|nr:ATP-binding protein [Thalassovita sp.]
MHADQPDIPFAKEELQQRLQTFRFTIWLQLALLVPWSIFLLLDGDTARLSFMALLLAISGLVMLLLRQGYHYVARVFWIITIGVIFLITSHIFGANTSAELSGFMLLGLPLLVFSWQDEFRTALWLSCLSLVLCTLIFAHDVLPLRGMFFPIQDHTPSDITANILMVRLSVAVLLIAQIWHFSRRSYIAQRGARLAREKALGATRAKGDFLANMSHEIRTPMNGIVGMIEILETMHLSISQSRAVGTIRSSAFALLGIIDDILDASKIEAGKLSIEPSDCELQPLVEQTALTLQPLSDELNVRLHLLIHPKLPEWVETDAGRLRQVLLNLLSNAIKYSATKLTQRTGSVRFHVEPGAKETVIFTISDNGIGMSEAVQRELFQPFASGESFSRKQVGGTGLGLAITHELVTLMNGKIVIRSTEGRGTKITVILPLPTARGPKVRPTIAGCNTYLVAPQTQYERQLYHTRIAEAGGHLEFVEDPTLFLEMLEGPKPHPIFLLSPAARSNHPDLRERIAAKIPDARFLILSSVRHADFGQLDPRAFQIQTHPTMATDLYRALGQLSGAIPTLAPVEAAPRATVRENAQRSIDFANKCVLVVEDNAINQTVLSSQLEQLNIDHAVVSNGLEGIRSWQSGLYDVILTDCHMPVMDGFEMVGRIRETEAQLDARPTPIIAITANAQSSEAKRCIEAGMSAFLAKPFELQQLRRTLAHALDLD